MSYRNQQQIALVTTSAVNLTQVDSFVKMANKCMNFGQASGAVCSMDTIGLACLHSNEICVCVMPHIQFTQSAHIVVVGMFMIGTYVQLINVL
eukprot:1928346-Amphidinium_carterae.2